MHCNPDLPPSAALAAAAAARLRHDERSEQQTPSPELGCTDIIAELYIHPRHPFLHLFTHLLLLLLLPPSLECRPTPPAVMARSLWRKFQFFEKTTLPDPVAEDIRGDRVTFSTAARGRALFGTGDGHIVVLGRRLETTYTTKVSEGRVVAAAILKKRKVMLTLGVDYGGGGLGGAASKAEVEPETMVLKVWSLEDVEVDGGQEGRPDEPRQVMPSPPLIKAIKLFPSAKAAQADGGTYEGGNE